MMKITKTNKKIPFPVLRGSLDNMQYPAFAEIKADGEFNIVHLSSEASFCVNKYGKIREDFPHLNGIKDIVLRRYSSATFLAELYINNGKNGDLYELLKQKDSDALKIYPFDVIEVNHRNVCNFPLIDRKEFTESLPRSSNGDGLRLVNNKAEVLEYFKYVTDHGYEGIVVKSLNSKITLGICDWVKVKSKDRNDYEIHLIDPTQERIEVRVPVSQPQFSGHQFVTVGVKCQNKYKKHIKVGDLVEIEHQGILASGSLRHPVLIPKGEWGR